MLLNCGVGENSWESLGLQADQTGPSYRKSVLNIHWKDWSWSWSSNTLTTWWEKPSNWERPWCWEILKTKISEWLRLRWLGWHHRLSGHEFDHALGVSEEQGNLVFCSPLDQIQTGLNEWTTSRQRPYPVTKISSKTKAFSFQCMTKFTTNKKNKK